MTTNTTVTNSEFDDLFDSVSIVNEYDTANLAVLGIITETLPKKQLDKIEVTKERESFESVIVQQHLKTETSYPKITEKIIKSFKYKNLLAYVAKIGIVDTTNPSKHVHIKEDKSVCVFMHAYINIPEFKDFIINLLKNKTAQEVLSKPLRFKFNEELVFDKGNKPIYRHKNYNVISSIYTYTGVKIIDTQYTILPSQNKKDSKVEQYHKSPWVNATNDSQIVPIIGLSSGILTIKIKLSDGSFQDIIGRIKINVKTGHIDLVYRNTDKLKTLLKNNILDIKADISELCIAKIHSYTVLSTANYQDYHSFAYIPVHDYKFILFSPVVQTAIDKLTNRINADKYMLIDIVTAIEAHKATKELKFLSEKSKDRKVHTKAQKKMIRKEAEERERLKAIVEKQKQTNKQVLSADKKSNSKATINGKPSYRE